MWEEYTSMKKRILSFLLVLTLLCGIFAMGALADGDEFAYEGEEVAFIKADGSGFGMFTAQEGTTCAIEGDSVVIHFVPKNTTVYGAIHWGQITDETLSADLAFNEDGTFDILLPVTSCGKAIPVAPVKKSDGATTKDQYYLAIPAADKLGAPASAAAADILVNVTISVAGEVKAPAVPVVVADRNADGGFNVDEVLYAAHEQLYPGGAAAGYASSETDWGLAIDMLWGDTSYAFGYYVNNTMAMGLTDPVENGGSVYAYVFSDKETYGDIFSYFDKTDAVAEDGTLALTLYAGSFDENWNVVFAPCAGAKVTIDGKATDFVTDENGQVTVRFDAAGSYLVSAEGDGATLVPAICKVTADQAAAPILIAPGPELIAPGPELIAPAGRTYTVAPGDYLWKIAQKFYGTGLRWGDIYRANTGTIRNPSLIFAGQVLVIPD